MTTYDLILQVFLENFIKGQEPGTLIMRKDFMRKCRSKRFAMAQSSLHSCVDKVLAASIKSGTIIRVGVGQYKLIKTV